MFDSDDEEYSEEGWREVRGSLTNADMDMVTDQLGVMGSAQIVYSDESDSIWKEDLVGKYEQMVDAFGGEQEVEQYIDIGSKGFTVAVERDGEPVFVVYGDEEGYSKSSRFNFGLGTLM